MAFVARSFNGSSDTITLAVGRLNAIRNGARTYACVAKLGATQEQSFLQFNDAGGIKSGLIIGNASEGGNDNNAIGLQDSVAGSFIGNLPLVVADGWACIGVTKAAGTVAPVGHRLIYTSGAWTHTTAANNVADVAGDTLTSVGITGSGFGVGFLNGRMVVAGAWTRALTNEEFESLGWKLTAWLGARPDGLWLPAALATGIPVLDLTGGSHQSGISGTSVVIDAPVAFDVTLPALVRAKAAAAVAAVWTPTVISQYMGTF